MSNAMREQLRDAFPESSVFLFEHLANGYFCVQIEQGVQLKSKAGENLEQNIEIGKVLVDRLKEKLRFPLSPCEDLMKALVTSPCDSVDVAKLKAFKESFDANFGEDEVKAAREEMKLTLANRKWLRDNGKTLATTEQTKAFHAHANELRAERNRATEHDMLLWAYIAAISK